jgi:16S rRNA (cytidine1402-2'-O)-methyltransferase
VLGDVDTILAEDTRRTRFLLDHHGIGTPGGGVLSCHDHNEASRIQLVQERLAAGRSVALVTDAGTPAISDPGYRLVKATWDGGHQVVPIPGACAAVAALSASGLPTDRFTFAGFPPKKAGARGRFLDELATAPGTLVLYAAARDVPDILESLSTTRGNPPVAIFREITKQYEECLRGPADALRAEWLATPRKGEVTILADRPADRAWDDADLLALLRSQSPKEVAALTGVSKRHLYQLKLALKGQKEEQP